MNPGMTMAEPANRCAQYANDALLSVATTDEARSMKLFAIVTVASVWLWVPGATAQTVADDALGKMKQRISQRCEKHMSGLGQDMLDECVGKDLDALVKLVESYPLKYRHYIHACDAAEGKFGWRNVKTCVDRRIDKEHAVTQDEPAKLSKSTRRRY